ncbi:synaptonemal complex protein ZEP1-like isoform X2 [Tasmannia lanceolata]|uniref:synaptonemal complex protein ZEP1-like isoform X2 n=1 Tax=Tasmannia lanceolata TaxID=3420 RepID=UPI004063FB6A
MQKLGFSSMKTLDQLRSFTGSAQSTDKTFPISSRATSDSISYGSFTNLKLTAEKLVKEQASVKTDLEMAYVKLKKSAEQISTLEAKLQEAINENAKLKVKQKEEAKLWNGLDSKLSSTKMLCDQLTETLQHLAGQVREAEEDKKFFEDKLSESAKAFDDMQLQMNDLSMKLESAEENIKSGKQELMDLRQEKEEMENFFGDERCATGTLISEKDAVIKQFHATVEEDKIVLRSLNSQLQDVNHELSLKDDICKCLSATQEKLEKEINVLQSSNEDFAQKVLASGQEIKVLEDSVHNLVEIIIELDKYSANVSNNVVQLFSVFDTCYKLLQQESNLSANCAQRQFNQLHDRFLHVTSENDAFQSEIEVLKTKVTELQKVEEFVMVQHAEECRITEEKVRRLESEAESLVSKKVELETLVTTLEGNIKHLSEASTHTENQMQDLLLKISRLESENQDIQEKLQSTLQGKEEEIETLQEVIAKSDQHVDSLENQVSQLCDNLAEKEQLFLQLKDREKELEEQRAEIKASLATAESTLTDARKQYDLMLEGKQLELSKHLKEISQRNDQAINDIRRKYEVEKQEILNLEKEKAEKLNGEMEKKCDERLAESKEEARQYLQRVQEEHGALISRIQQEHEKKELSLKAHHYEEQQRIQLQAENELREKTILMRKDHEVQVKSLKHQHEDECRKLREELDLQKSKEERQRALLQLQWRVMDENQHEDAEVNSKKEFSVSSIKMRDSDGRKGDQLALVKPLSQGKVTRHEYEVETSNGRTITKRRKTKSTVMFGDPTTHKRLNAKNTKTSKDVMKQKVIKEGRSPHNIGDLFSEGSLNPYNDDPYAFD